MAEGAVGSAMGPRIGQAIRYDANGNRLDQYGKPINPGFEPGYGQVRGGHGFNINTMPGGAGASGSAFSATSMMPPGAAPGGMSWSMAPRDTATDTFNEGKSDQYNKDVWGAENTRRANDPLNKANYKSISDLLADPEAINDQVQAKIQAKQAGIADANTSAQRRQGMGVLGASGQMDAGSIAAMNERLGRTNLAAQEAGMSDLEVTRANQRNRDIMGAQNQASGQVGADTAFHQGQEDRYLVQQREPSESIPFMPNGAGVGGVAGGAAGGTSTGGTGVSDLDMFMGGPRMGGRDNSTAAGFNNFSGGGGEYTNTTMAGGAANMNQPTWKKPKPGYADPDWVQRSQPLPNTGNSMTSWWKEQQKNKMPSPFASATRDKPWSTIKSWQ